MTLRKRETEHSHKAFLFTFRTGEKKSEKQNTDRKKREQSMTTNSRLQIPTIPCERDDRNTWGCLANTKQERHLTLPQPFA